MAAKRSLRGMRPIVLWLQTHDTMTADRMEEPLVPIDHIA